jgi:hypothetical protein
VLRKASTAVKPFVTDQSRLTVVATSQRSPLGNAVQLVVAGLARVPCVISGMRSPLSTNVLYFSALVDV